MTMRTDIIERKNEILQWIQEERPKCWIATQLQCKQETLNRYLEKMGIEYSGQQNKKGQQKGSNKYLTALEYIKSTYVKAPTLKAKLIRDGLKEDKCERCGISEWQGEKLTLELHHKDGNHYNNTLSNLQILCPNCHSLTEKYNGRNNLGK